MAVSNASGVATSINSYDECGTPGAGNVGRFQYTGQMWLGEAGVYHFKARAYAPSLGRFLQADPIGYAGGLNLYAYVANDPVNFSDPWGQEACRADGTIADCDEDEIPIPGERREFSIGDRGIRTMFLTTGAAGVGGGADDACANFNTTPQSPASTHLHPHRCAIAFRPGWVLIPARACILLPRRLP